MLKPYGRSRFIAAFSLATLTLLFMTTTAIAGDKPRIQFAPGADSASLKGEIQGMDRDVYPITAKAGQTMEVKVSNRRNLVLFRIQKPGKGEAYLPKAGEDDDATQWTGVLPASGTYKIVVGAMQGDDTHYTLHVRVAR